MSKTRALVLLALTVGIFCSSLGDVAMSLAMKMMEAEGLLNSYLYLGITFHACFLAMYLFALSREDLSFVLPVTGLDYVLVTVFACLWAGEDVGASRWAGSLLVSAGVALVVKS